MQHGSIVVFTFGVTQCIVKAISLICAHVTRVIAGIVALPAVFEHNTVHMIPLQVGICRRLTSRSALPCQDCIDSAA